MRRLASMLCFVMLLSGCATGPSVQVIQQVPTLPPLSDLPEAAQGPTFTERMQRFLSGSLETRMLFVPPSSSAERPTVPPRTRSTP